MGAARALFLDGGYVATTMGAISRAADVPEPTVYRLFSSKLGILKALLDTSIAGDDEPIAVRDRPHVTALTQERAAAPLIAGFAAVTTGINTRSNDVFHMLQRAADADPEAARLYEEICKQRDDGQGRMVGVLHRQGSLRPGLTRRQAADIVHAVMSPEVYRLLVRDRGWSASQYQQWAERTLTQQLT
jgi:AcrR family transcriptional regulator